MPRFYGPGRSSTETEAMKNLCMKEKPVQKPRRRIQVWTAPEEPEVSLKRFIERMDVNDSNGNGNNCRGGDGNMRTGMLLHRKDDGDGMGAGAYSERSDRGGEE